MYFYDIWYSIFNVSPVFKNNVYILDSCFTLLQGDKIMLEDRGIRKGIEVFVKSDDDPNMPFKKARVVRTYPSPSRWLVVKYEDGDMKQVEESQVTTMFEVNRRENLL